MRMDQEFLNKLPGEQQVALEYLRLLYPDPNLGVEIRQRDDGTLVVEWGDRAAVIASNGDFMDPASHSDTPVVSVAYAEVETALQAHAAEQAQNN